MRGKEEERGAHLTPEKGRKGRTRQENLRLQLSSKGAQARLRESLQTMLLLWRDAASSRNRSSLVPCHASSGS